VDFGHHYLRERAENATAVTFVELFFDLVYVFAVTQISHLLLGDLSWYGAFHEPWCSSPCGRRGCTRRG
jgi:low temperature requirement protein LtrA